jgi:hypothetical protein
MLGSKLLGELLVMLAARGGRLGQGIVAAENLGALDAPDDDPFGAGVVEDRDAAADFGAVWCVLSSVSTLLHLCASASIICMLMQNSYFSL